MPRRPTPIPRIVLDRRRFIGSSLAVAAIAPIAPRQARAAGVVNVYNWDTYIGEDTLDQFTEATGIDVRYDLFASNDELFAKLKEGNPGYDVIVPTNDFTERMIIAEMIQPLDHGKIPNVSNIAERFSDPGFDPGRQFSMPYMWGTMGIGYRTTEADPAPTQWADIFDSDQFSGRMSILNDTATLQIVFKYLGESLNSTDPALVEKAADVLIKAKPHITAFSPDTGQDLLLSGEVDACLEWSGDVLQVIEEDDELAYVVPEEGSLLWEDTLCIATGAPNSDSAHAFINFILEAEVHGAIAEYIKYGCPNEAAMAFIPEEDLNNPQIYPPEEVLARCEVPVYPGEEAQGARDKALTRVLAA
ncbi:MAG: PotD/PotF family extracellular solute-binding protein [Geminicoccaceae bacterium]